MKKYLQLALQFAAYTAAAIVILLAIAVGLFRLFLPRLPEYQDEIKSWASDAIGMQVEFSGMDARWGLSGPELKFYGAELIRPADQTRALAAGEVGVGVSLMRLLTDRTLVVDTVTISETAVEIRQLEDGSWRIQGTPFDELFTRQPRPGTDIGSFAVVGEDIELRLIYPGDERPTFIELDNVVVQRDAVRIAIDADLRVEQSIGDRISIAATKITPEDGALTPWNVSVEANDLVLGGLAELYPELPRRFGGGSGDIDISFAVLGRRVVTATADIDFESVELGDGEAFDISGRFDWNTNADGWLVAADEVRLSSISGDWPEAALRLETSTDRDRNIVMLDASASYLNLADIGLFMPWLEGDQREYLDRLRPSGVVRDLVVTVSELDSETPGYSVAVELDKVGVASVDDRPGLRGFSGSVRANDEGGLLEISSYYMELRLPAWLNEMVEVDLMEGTVIWRQRDEHITIVSDNIAIATPFFDSQSNIQVTIDGENAPHIDLRSTWSVADIGAVRRFLPESLMRPRSYRWYQDALISGQVTRAETRYLGPLDRMALRNGEGALRTEATIRDMDFRYNRRFPVARVFEAEVLLDNTRLYSDSNRSVSLGNSTVDATVEIADLLNPVLRLQSYTTGTLDSLHTFTANSPIARVFGGNLDRIHVAGDATVTLDLTIPVRNWRAFEFTASVQSINGSLALQGLPAPLTELSGTVHLDRENISSESLGGQFLGEPVTISLRNATIPEYRVVASMFGVATAEALIAEMGVPLDSRLEGRSNYRVDVMFPRGNVDALTAPDDPGAREPAPLAERAPLLVRGSSDLNGMRIDLPPPYGKSADESRNVNGEMVFVTGGEQIEVSGEAENDFAWLLDFTRLDKQWDFDRGLLLLGDGDMSTPEVRGLHIRGQAPEVNLSDWLALSRGGAPGVGVATRIRSIDLEIADLYVLGQHYENQHVRVDRSARDWLVQVDGDLLSGSVFVPYDFSADRELVLDMQRLVLPGDDDREAASAVTTSIDPRSLPSILLKAEEFAIGNRFLGAVEVEFRRTPLGLEAESILANDASFDVVGNGGWQADSDDPLGSRSYLRATITSTDIPTTMARLDYEPGIVGDDMGVLLDMSWSGGPRMDFFESLDGEVQVRIGTGQLDLVDPGAGRMFGLMSIVALPRRLSLDFRDVFQKGFGFDKISGRFRIEDGIAWTCDLALSGPAADIGIIGSVDLVNRDYDQAAVVSANVGNTLPVVGAVVAGPQAAAVMFLFSRIFKKPLQDIGQVYYSVQGSWDEPDIENADADTFMASGRLSGCLQETE